MLRSFVLPWLQWGRKKTELNVTLANSENTIDVLCTCQELTSTHLEKVCLPLTGQATFHYLRSPNGSVVATTGEPGYLASRHALGNCLLLIYNVLSLGCAATSHLELHNTFEIHLG